MKKHFDLISIGVLLLLGPLFIFPKETWNWILLSAVSILFFGRWILERRFLPKTPIDAAMALLLVMALSGVFVIKTVGESTGKIVGLIYGIVVFYVLIEALKTLGRVKISVVVFLALGLGLALIGILGMGEQEYFITSVAGKLPKIPHINFGLTGAEKGVNPNPLGGSLLLFIPIGIMQFSLLIKRKIKSAAPLRRGIGLGAVGVILGVQALAVILSSSFGAWLSLAVALWLMGERKRPLKAIIAGLILAMLVFGSLKTGEPVKGKRPGILWFIGNSAHDRIDKWKNALEVVKTHPVFGIGMDQLRRTPKFKYEDSHAHNQFLHTAAELGIPGLIAYAAIFIGVFWMGGEVRRSAMPEWMRLTSRGLGIGIFAFTLFGMGDAIPLGAKPGIFFWISLSMITSIYIYGRNNGWLDKTDE
jgi:putative inorganic carbon (HCO3(-)) transporter